mmetsp:Transcript_32196/g.36550  ORF Transcript_32196/g.36550 Transcript_32196/m.36550 type:complete len:257 (+) Transcript_32196:47-817(+)
MRQSKSMVNADRTAIRQALGILEEGAIIEDNDIEFPSNINIDEELRIRHNQALSSRKAVLKVSWSPTPTKGLFNDQYRTNISSGSFLKAIPDLNSKQQEIVSETDDSCSSYDGSSLSDRNREVGGKAKRKSHAKRSKRPHAHKSTKEENNSTNSVKFVRFSKYDQINYIPHINDISQEEIDQSWMNEEDYYSIRSRSLRLVEMIEDEKRYPISADTMIVNKHLVCVRGLVDKTSQCVYERDRLQRKLQTAVFRLQQ